MCRVSIVMAAFNEQSKIRRSLDAALSQIPGDIEVLVMDDGSTDSTPSVLAAIADRRLHIFRNPANQGLTKSLNTLIRCYARGHYIARLDAGDACSPNRLAVQSAFLDDNPDYVLVGCCTAAMLDADGQFIGYRHYPATDEEIRRCFQSSINPFLHSSVIFRRSAYDRVEGYDERYVLSQDIDLWLRLLEYGKGANVAGPVVYSELSRGLSLLNRAQQNALAQQAFASWRRRTGAEPAGPDHRGCCAQAASRVRRWFQRRISSSAELSCFWLSLRLGNKKAARKWLERSALWLPAKTAALILLPFIPASWIKKNYVLSRRP